MVYKHSTLDKPIFFLTEVVNLAKTDYYFS